MLKLVGSILILFGTAGFGLYKSSLYRKQIRDLTACKNIGIYLRSQKKYMRLPFEVLLRSCAVEQEARFAVLLQQIAEQMEQQEHGSVEQIWSRMLEEHRREFCLEERQRELFVKLGKAILEETDGTDSSQFYFYLMDQELEHMLKEQKNVQKLYQTISVSAGILLILVLM